MANFNNLNQSIAGLKPGATPVSTNVTADVVANNHSQVTINNHNYPQPGQRSATDDNAGTRQLPTPNTSATSIGVHNEGTMTQSYDNCTFHIGSGGQPQSKPDLPQVDNENQILALLKIIHRNTWEKTETSVGDTFTSDRFPEPDFEVHPQMVESPHFYRGGHPVEETESAPPTKRPKLEVVKKPKYKKDHRFTFRKFDDETQKTLSVSSVMKKIHLKSKKLGVLGVIAQAGAGKTTCMRRWARRTLKLNGISEKNGYLAGKGCRFQMVHFLDIKNIPMLEISSLREFLFKGLFGNEDSTKNAYNWVLDNQNQVAIFLDGLDQAQQKITMQDMKAVGNYGEANCSRILYNLLTRNLLPGVRIIISTREHAAASLPPAARIADIITLTGFSLDDAKKLFNAVTSTDHVEDHSVDFSELSYEDVVAQPTTQPFATDSLQSATPCSSMINVATPEKNRQDTNWDKLVERSFALLSFITVPIFLMFTALVYKRFGRTPASITELLMKVFQTLPDSTVIQSCTTEQSEGNIWTTIHRLKKLSYKKLNDGFVLFSSEDLTNHDLSVDHVQDLLLMVPKSRSLSHRLIEGDNVFFFCHQILQEFLSACFIVEMTLKDFKEFVKTYLHEDHWSVVRRLLCGLLFSSSEELGKLLQISDSEKYEKQDILRESLAKQLEGGHGLAKERQWERSLEPLAAIYESNDESVIQLITSIDTKYHPLSSDGAHLIGSLVARCKKLNSLNLYFCDLDNDLLHIMAKSIGYPKIQISYVRLLEDSCSFDFAALNNFLEHIDCDDILIDATTYPMPRDVKADGQRCEFDWNNIRLLSLYSSSDDIYGICFHNRDDSIMLTFGEEEKDFSHYFGIYNKKDKILSVMPEKNRSSLILQTATFAVHWLNRYTVSLDIKEKLGAQYLHYKCLTVLGDTDLTGNRQIENIVLDFQGSSNIEKCWRDITSIGKKFQVKVMDLVILFWRIEDWIDKFKPLFRLHDFKLKIHVITWYDIDTVPEDIPKQLAILNRRNVQIESVRRVFDYDDDISRDNLAPWIHNLSKARVKQFFIICNSLPMITDHEKLEFEAHSHGIELKFVDFSSKLLQLFESFQQAGHHIRHFVWITATELSIVLAHDNWLDTPVAQGTYQSTT